MKRRLFWKILIGFWITVLIITHGIWLMFALLRPLEQSAFVREQAGKTVAAAVSALKLGGDQELHIQRASWPRDSMGHLEVYRDTGKPDPRPALAHTMAAGPDGTRYSVSYYARPQPTWRGIFAIPREVVIVAIIGGLGFSAILAWYLTRPVESMRAGFGRLAQGDFSTRLGPAVGRRRDEIADLAHDFDRMAVRLQELVGARDRLLADVSHELRTPLARLNLAVGLARQDPAKLATSLDRIGDEVAKLDEMVGELLTLAKLESGQSRAEEYFDFAEVVRGVVRDAQFEAGAKNIKVIFSAEPADEAFEWLAVGSGKLISRATENIIRNALRYSPENGQVRVALRLEPGIFRLSVCDEGPGVGPEALATLFKPFGVSADGFGFGLGLAIAQRAIAVHGGTILAHNRTPKGLEMTVTIPATTLDIA
jgi:two-component system OmpR family sensor kinase